MSSFRKLWAKPRQCLSCPLLFFPPSSSFAGKLEKGKKGGEEEEEGGQSSYTRKASIVLVLWSVCARSVEGRTDLPSPFFLGKKYILLLRCGVVGCGKERVGRCVTFLWGYRTLSILPLPFFISVEGRREKSFPGRAPSLLRPWGWERGGKGRALSRVH